jgi:hypothetical protein
LARAPTGPAGPAGADGADGEPGIGFEPTGYVTVPASAFVSYYSSDEVRIGIDVQNYEATSFAYFRAPALLPHGVTVTNVTA